MADKKKMSVADILAAARKSDGGDSAAGSSDAPADQPAASEPVAEQPAAEKPTAIPKSGSGRPSVADMMAMARGEKSAPAKSEAKPAAKAAAKPVAKAEAKAKPAVKAEPKGPRDTASILAAARKQSKPGPMTKAEAAKLKDSAGKGPAKPKAPPMPAKPAYAKPATKSAAAPDQGRRFVSAAASMLVGSFLAVGFSSLTVTLGMWTLGLARFMFPNILREPPSKFKVGFPADFPPGFVETKYKAKFGVWVVNGTYEGQSQLYALQSVCTHLGCTPNWLEAEQKFKCPCHGSGFYKDGINFEGPAPRPLERYAIRIADDGQIEIDKSQTFQQEMGGWEDPMSYVSA